METTRTRRDSYHHGDLRNALVAAATELARGGGPEAVVLREAARRVGVSATAAYRHFDGHGDLVLAVKAEAQGVLAARMQEAVRAGAPLPDAAEEAERRLRALAQGYVAFALAEPGLYHMAFHRDAMRAKHAEGAQDGPPARSYLLLTEVLDDLVAAGRLSPARRPFAETSAWAPVHGLCLLLLDDSLGPLEPGHRQGMVDHLVETVVIGLRGT